MRLAAEALVVFLGVWSAFLLDGCRERQEEARLRAQIHEALRHDIAETILAIESASEWFDQTFVQEFLEPLEAGERPHLTPIPISAGRPDEGWNAILASGGLEVLDLELIRSVEAALATSRWVSEVALDYNQYVRTILVPELDGPVDVSIFYLEDSPRLRSKYLWYYYSLTTIQRGFEDLLRELKNVEQMVQEASTQ